MATKPTNLAEWATDVGAPVVEPSTPQKQAGWPVDYKPPAQWFNWWMELVHYWVVWLDAFESEAHTWTAAQTFDNSATFNAAINANATVNLNDQIEVGTTGQFNVQKPIDFNIAAAATPILRRSQTASTPHLLFEQLVDGSRKLRIYITVDRGLEATYNARYSGGNWFRDAVADAWRLSLGKGLRHYQAPSGGATFADAAWVQILSTFDTLGDGIDGLKTGYVYFGNSALGEITAGQHVPQRAWANITLSANLTPDVSFPPQYYRDTTGRVWFRGYATANTTIASAAQIGTLPHAIERYQTNVLLVGAGASHSGLVSMILQPSTNRIDLQNSLGGGNVTAGMLIPFENISYRPL